MAEKVNNGAVPCSDIDPAELLEQNVFPEVYHDLTEVNRDVISDLSFREIVVIEEECSRCEARIPGIMVLSDPPESMQEFKRMTYDVYEAFYANPRSIEHVDLNHRFADLAPEAMIEISKTLMLAAALASDDAEDVAGKRSKKELWVRILGPEYADVD